MNGSMAVNQTRDVYDMLHFMYVYCNSKVREKLLFCSEMMMHAIMAKIQRRRKQEYMSVLGALRLEHLAQLTKS